MSEHDLSPIVELVADQVRAKHPDWHPGQVYSEVIAAIVGKGDFAEFYAILRGRLPLGPAEQTDLMPPFRDQEPDACTVPPPDQHVQDGAGPAPPAQAPGESSPPPEETDHLAPRQEVKAEMQTGSGFRR